LSRAQERTTTAQGGETTRTFAWDDPCDLDGRRNEDAKSSCATSPARFAQEYFLATRTIISKGVSIEIMMRMCRVGPRGPATPQASQHAEAAASQVALIVRILAPVHKLQPGGRQAMTHTMNKVSQVTFAFWVMKISATTLGETGGDLLSMTLNLGYVISTVIFFGIFIITLVAQVGSKVYHPFLYWAVIISTTTAGTTMSDYLDRTAILFSNTLGTALGDFLADSSGLGYEGGALVIAGLLAVIVVVYLVTNVSRTLLFWLAFVLTRPLGATLGDFLTKTHQKGGLDLGTIGSSLVLACFLIGCILVTNRRRPDRAGRKGPRE
jgi:uncharacterized membrane-anchored protein